MNALKMKAAKEALRFVEDDMVLGIGTGSTVNYFINELKAIKCRIDGCVASSLATETLLKQAGIPVLDLNVVSDLPLYIDGADEVNAEGEMIKGGGGAMTREKIIANVAQKFICIVDRSKIVKQLGTFPVAVEVLPLARSYAARQLLAYGDPVYREGYITDNGNIILDVYNLTIDSPSTLEDTINTIPGVVENGIFGKRLADIIIAASEEDIEYLKQG